MTPERFAVEFTPAVAKDLRQLGGLRGEALQKITSALRANPEAGHQLKGGLRPFRSFVFSMPGGAYRAAYILREDRTGCTVVMVGPRENFYERLARRIR